VAPYFLSQLAGGAGGACMARFLLGSNIYGDPAFVVSVGGWMIHLHLVESRL
jgi:hypothetical protein